MDDTRANSCYGEGRVTLRRGEWTMSVETSHCTPSVQTSCPKPTAPLLVASKSRLACPLRFDLAFRKLPLIVVFHPEE